MNNKKSFREKLSAAAQKPLFWCCGLLCMVIMLGGAVCISWFMSDKAVIQTDGEQPQTTQADAAVITGEVEEELQRVLPENLLVTSVSAASMEGKCIKTDTEFELTTAEDLDAGEVGKLLSLTPELPFEITKTDSCKYSMKLSEKLPLATNVKLTLDDGNGNTAYSWAFQTEDIFRIKSAYPADKTSYVPTDTGIEIEFSMKPDVDKIKDYFSISPEVEGRFECYRTTLVFVPKKALDSNTVYSVTLEAGMPSEDGIKLEEKKNFCFKTSNSDNKNYCYSINGISETFLPEDRALVEILCSTNLLTQDFTVSLYQYMSADDYYSSLKEYTDNTSWEQDYTFSTDGLTSVYSEIMKPVYVENEYNYGNSPAFLPLPESLDRGWYLADITMSYGGINYHIQRHIQISDMSVFAQSLPGESVFFVNDTVSGKCISDAEIVLETDENTYSARTDGRGIAELDIEENDGSTGILKIVGGGYTFTDVFETYYEDDDYFANNYYTYIYTDRETYHSDDTVRVWGIILPRNKTVEPVPENLSLKMGSWNVDESVIPLTIKENGTFTAEISFSSLSVSYRYLYIMCGETQLAYKHVNIYDYVKPTYVIETETPDYAWMPQLNPVDIGVKVSYFDGTPAAGYTFEVGGYDLSSATPSTITTNEDGYAKTSVYTNSYDDWHPQNADIYFGMTGIENEYQYSYAKFIAVYRDIMLETDFSKDGTNGRLDLSANVIDPNKIEPNMPYYYYYDNASCLKGAPADTVVTGVLTRSWMEKIPNGTYYDFIEKKNVTKYKYEYNSETVGTYTANVTNGKGAFEDIPMLYEDSSYSMDLSWNDTKGQRVTSYAYLYDNYYDNYYERNSLHYYTLSSDSSTFTENQKLGFTLCDNYKEVPDAKGRIFYAVTDNGFISLNISESAAFEHVMTDAYVPNVSIGGAYFDGKHVFPIYTGWSYYCFDPKEREIKLDVSTDKDEYAPGDTITVSVKAEDTQGNSVSGASVLLSVVDEAAFAVAPQTADPLADIYSAAYLPSVKNYYSYIQHSFESKGGAEKGGGGDEGYVRKNFLDTAAFMKGITSADGTASFVVAMPDNITTWRATVQAVGYNGSSRLCAGTQKLPVVVTQPMSINPIMLSQYVYGDDVTLSAVCVGDAAKNTTITAHLTGSTTDVELTAESGKGFEFGKLEKGSYKVVFSAKNGADYDAVEMPFEVVDTLLEIPVFESFDLSKDTIDVEPQRWPMSIAFTNREYLICSNILKELVSTYSSRCDITTAQAYAQKELGYLTEEEYISEYGGIGANGYVGETPYSEGDCGITAMLCTATPELVEKTRVATLFYDTISDRDAFAEDVASAYLGLAALSEPVLNEVLDILENPVGFSDGDKLKLCAALALLGDYNNAISYYTQFTSEIKLYNNLNTKINANINDDVELTSIALVTASVLNLPEAEGMARWLYGRSAVYQPHALEMVTYLRYYAPKNFSDASVEYSMDGSLKTIELNRYRPVCVSFTEEQYKNGNIRVKSGSVLADVYYTGRLEDRENAPKLTVTKTVSEVDSGMTPGKCVKVTIDVSGLSERYFCVDDIIPSGARYYYSEKQGCYIKRSGQRLKIYSCDSSRVSYYMYLVTPGDYVFESAVAQKDDKEWGYSERSVLSIEDYE